MLKQTYSWILLAAVVMLMLDVCQLQAFTFAEPKWIWPKSKASKGIVMHLQLGSSGTMMDGHSSWDAAAESAMAIWNSHLDEKNFSFRVVRNSTIPKRGGDGKNSVFWSSSVYGKPFGSSTLAICLSWTKKGAKTESDVIFNNSYSWNSYRGDQKTAAGGGPLYDFRRVAMHEFGHALGMDHPNQAGQFVYALMNSSVSNIDTVEEDDVYGSQLLWAGKQSLRGNLNADSGVVANNATVGAIQANLSTSQGRISVSGKIWMDGRVSSFKAKFHDGELKFPAGKIFTTHLNLQGRRLSLIWNGNDGLRAGVYHDESGGTSSGIVQRAVFNKHNRAPWHLLNRTKTGYFTSVVQTQTQSPPKPLHSYPQGLGMLTTTLSYTGSLRTVGALSDGTKVTASSHLVSDTTSPIFFRLPTPGSSSRKEGSFLGSLVFDTSKTSSDMLGLNWQWFRPAVTQTSKAATRIYTDGWPNGITVDVIGALYDSKWLVQDALELGSSDFTDGNARLTFSAGKTVPTMSVRDFNITGNKVQKLDPKNKSMSLSLNAKTGALSGTFIANWADPSRKLPTFRGVLLQKGTNKLGGGFSISNVFNDLDPESTKVQLRKQ